MKNYMIICMSAFSILLVSCHKKPSLSIPSCIMEKIETIKNQPKWNPPATVEEYMYKGKTIYLFSSPCCDRYNEAFDQNCNYVCSPSGGYTGKGDRKCEDFKDAAQFVKVIWKDDRQ